MELRKELRAGRGKKRRRDHLAVDRDAALPEAANSRQPTWLRSMGVAQVYIYIYTYTYIHIYIYTSMACGAGRVGGGRRGRRSRSRCCKACRTDCRPPAAQPTPSGDTVCQLRCAPQLKGRLGESAGAPAHATAENRIKHNETGLGNIQDGSIRGRGTGTPSRIESDPIAMAGSMQQPATNCERLALWWQR